MWWKTAGVGGYFGYVWGPASKIHFKIRYCPSSILNDQTECMYEFLRPFYSKMLECASNGVLVSVICLLEHAKWVQYSPGASSKIPTLHYLTRIDMT